MEKRIGRLISIIYRKSQIFLGQALKQFDITSAEYPILMVLNQRNGATQEELSSTLYIDKSAVARVVQSLVSKGFVTKKKDENDQRCNRIYLTSKGHEVHTHIEKALDDWNGVLMMDMKEERYEEVYQLLLHMVQNVKVEFLNRKYTEDNFRKNEEIKDGRKSRSKNKN